MVKSYRLIKTLSTCYVLKKYLVFNEIKIKFDELSSKLLLKKGLIHVLFIDF